MASTAELGILLKARDEASGVMNNIKNLALGMGAAFVATAVLAVKAAEEEEVHMTKLFQAVSGTKDGWDVASGAIEDFLGTQRAVSGFSRGELADALALITAQTSSYAEAQQRLHYAEDIARGTNLDLYAASKLVGKVTDENINVFGRMGIVVKKGTTETQLFALVQEKFGGQSAAYAGTAAGQWAILQDTIHQLLAVLGTMLLPLLTKGIGFVLDFVNSFTAGGALQSVGAIFQEVITILGELFGVITGSAPDAGAALSAAIGPEAASIVMQVLATIRDSFKFVFGFIGDLMTAFRTGDWGLLQDSFSEGSLRIQERLGQLVGAVGQLIGNLIAKLIAALPGIRDQLLEWGRAFFAWVGPAALQLLQNLLGMLSQMLGWLGDHAEEIGTTLIQWGLKFGEFVITVAIPELLKALGPLLLTIGTWVLTEGIPGVIRFFFGLGKGIIEGILNGLGGLKDAVWNALVAAFQAIDITIGPFHVTGHGIYVQMPHFDFPDLPHFDQGGIIPGPIGSPQLVIAHGGEEVRTRGQQSSGGGSGVTLVFNAPVYGMSDFEDKVKSILRDGRLGGGFRGV